MYPITGAFCSEKANAFWEPVLTRGWTVPIGMHIIVPTMLYTVPREIDPAEYPDRTAIELESMRFHCMCCMCDAHVANQCVLSGIRCIISKQEIDNGFFIYRTALMSVEICVTCAATHGFHDLPKLNSDHIMINGLLDSMEREALELRKDLICVDMGVEKFFDCFMLRMRTVHSKMMTVFGKMENRCACCGKRCPTSRCSRCHFVHYCSVKCSKKNWSKHKLECGFLKKTSLFMAPQYQFRIK